MSKILIGIPTQPTNLPTMNTLNDSRSFMFLFNIFMIEMGADTGRYHNG